MTPPIISLEALESHIEKIWEHDLLGRRHEADSIQMFCKNRSAALGRAGRVGAMTLGIDAPYGVGKTYFLRHLFDQVSLRHPAAYIDAWADDTIDAPWSALIVAIEEAIKRFSSFIDPAISNDVRQRAGAVLTALAKGAAKKAASYVVGDDGFEDVVDAIFEREGEKMLSDFKDRKAAITRLKEALGRLFVTLQDYADAPIFIFVDELDRCRPTYAIKMMEEMKHLFDVTGVVFIVGMNREQLTKSVAAVYGSEFDAEDYLRRFIEKVYRLSSPSNVKLVRYHLERGGFDTTKFTSPALELRKDSDDNVCYITECVEYWDCSPRNIIKVVDAVLTASEVWPEKSQIVMPFLCPMLIREVMGKAESFLHEAPRNASTDVSIQVGMSNSKYNVSSLYALFKEKKASTYRQLIDLPGANAFASNVYLADIARVEYQQRAPIDPDKRTMLNYYDTLVNSLAKLD